MNRQECYRERSRREHYPGVVPVVDAVERDRLNRAVIESQVEVVVANRLHDADADADRR